MKRKISIFAPCIIVILLVGFFGVPAVDLRAAPDVNQAAIAYLKSKEQNAWTAMAFSVTGATPPATDYLKGIQSTKAIDYTSPILAITALNENPSTFSKEDYIAQLKSFWDGTQLGDPTLLNDDIFGLLALLSSGESVSSSVVEGIKTFALSKQNTDGGWGWSTTANSDTNMTAAVIMALAQTGVPVSNSAIQDALRYLHSAQNGDGGFPYDPQSDSNKGSDASSDAWVISAIYAVGQNPKDWIKNGANPIIQLESLQDSAGYFHHQLGSPETSFTPTETAYAIIALAGKYYPVRIFTSATFDFRIEGKTQTICQGKTQGPTALDVIKNAATVCGYDYNIQNTAYGPYLNRIAQDEASGTIGWLYLVSNASPSVGAADYKLQTGDQVLWYFGEWGWEPTMLSIAQNSDTAKISVKYFDGKEWQNLAGALVKVGNSQLVTDDLGEAIFQLTNVKNGSYPVYAEKEGFIRSNQGIIQVGAAPKSVQVSLKVNIQESQPEPDAISFSVEPDQIDFGTMKPGSAKTQSMTVQDQGKVGISLQVQTSGAPVFQDNLNIQGASSQSFYATLNSGETKTFPLQLSVPSDYKGDFGSQQGELIFWATKL